MSDLVSMLVPLQTLPGWPVVETPSALLFLLLAVAIPVGFGIVVMIITMGPTWVRSARGEVVLDKPVWLGAGTAPSAIEAAPTTDEIESVGGSSARW